MDIRFNSDLDRPDAVEAIVQALSSINYSVQTSIVGETTEVIGTTKRKPGEVLFTSEPQMLHWVIRRKNSSTELEFASRYASWYAMMLLVLVPYALGLWGVTQHWMFDKDKGLSAPPMLGVALHTLSGIIQFIVATWILANGSNVKSRMLRAVEAAFHDRGAEVARSRGIGTSRHTSNALFYAIAMGVITMAALPSNWIKRFDLITLVYIGVVVLFLVPSVYFFTILKRRAGAGERCALLAPALPVMIGFISLSILIATLEIIGRHRLDGWRRAGTSDLGLIVVLGVIFIFFFLFFLFLGLESAAESVRVERDVRNRRRAICANEAIDAKSYLPQLRWSLIGIGAMGMLCLWLPVLLAGASFPKSGAFGVVSWTLSDALGYPVESAPVRIGAKAIAVALITPLVIPEIVSI